ncbi:MAG: J domain-containing protein [Oleiphilaceae bacterium]|nr:J domain-containing protein [Oleiphilaceae bacterium]
MTCWNVLGIEPTRDREAIEKAYLQQRKFASSDESDKLAEAYQTALNEAGFVVSENQDTSTGSNSAPALSESPASGKELSAEETQIARDTVIQVRALLNDERRSQNVNLWRAILGEPPADQPHIRKAIGESLTQEVRPMAENGTFPADVTLFLGDWFGWAAVSGQAREIAEQNEAKADDTQSRGNEPADQEAPQSVSFWPAVIGWVVGLVILTSLFSGMGGG